jgi:hypothetical protein
MSTTPRLAVVLSVVLLTASGCAESTDGPGAGASPSTPGTAVTTPGANGTASPTTTSGGGVTLPADLRTRPAVAAAIADTASREGVAPDEVVIAGWSPVTWSDGSLGCPEEGMAYTQALVDGELLLLRVGTGLFQYHGGEGGSLSYCADPSATYTVRG